LKSGELKTEANRSGKPISPSADKPLPLSLLKLDEGHTTAGERHRFANVMKPPAIGNSDNISPREN